MTVLDARRLIPILVLPIAVACGGGITSPPPPPPAYLAATALGATSVRVDWNDAVFASRHRLYRDGTFLVELGFTATSSFTDTGLAHGVTHCYAMSSVDGAGQEGARSGVACATTDLFSTTLVDPAPSLGVACAIALAPGGGVHLAYHLPSLGEVRHASKVSGGWSRETVGTATSAFRSPVAIAVAKGGELHVVYTGAGIQHASGGAGGWSVEPVAAGAFQGGAALDSGGAVHVLHLGGASYDDVMVSSNATGQWVATTLAKGASNLTTMPLVIDSADHLHLAYALPDWAGVAYGTDASGAFVSELAGGYITDGAALALDAAGEPHLAYYGQVLIHATRRGGAWANQHFDVGALGQFASIALDPAGQAHLTGSQPLPDSVVYATDRSGGPASVVVDRADPRCGTAVAVDDEGFVHACYAGLDGLRYASTR